MSALGNEKVAGKKGFILYEPPPKPIVLPADFKKSKSVSRLNIKEYEPTIGLNEDLKTKYRYFYRPYKANTQKSVTNCLKFESEKHEWMNIAEIIINTKNNEFSNIIEFYRENHKDGYTDDKNSLNNKDISKKKKKKKSKFSIFRHTTHLSRI